MSERCSMPFLGTDGIAPALRMTAIAHVSSILQMCSTLAKILRNDRGFKRWATDGLILPARYYPAKRLIWNRQLLLSTSAFPYSIIFQLWGSQLHSPQDTSLKIMDLTRPPKSWQGSMTKTYKLLVLRVSFGLFERICEACTLNHENLRTKFNSSWRCIWRS